MSTTYEPSEDREKYPDDQMTPLKGGRYTTILHGPPGTEVGDLHCDLEPYMEGERPAIISHSGWMPTDEQVRKLEAGGHVRLAVWQHPIPPLAVSVEPPTCQCHGKKMAWDTDDGGFYCVKLRAMSTDELRGISSDADDDAKRAEREVRESFQPGPDADDEE